jgi:hypothetical protein
MAELSDKMPNSVIMVFTSKSAQEMIGRGESWAWQVNLEKASLVDYIVCTENGRREKLPGWRKRHGRAFLIARVSGVVAAPDDPSGRYKIIQFSEYAEIDIPSAWGGWRKGFKYGSLDDFKISVENLRFVRVHQN